MAMNIPRRPRVDPTFEGDRKWRELRNVEIQEAEDYPAPSATDPKPSDFAQREVREAVANVEDEISKLVQAEVPFATRESAERTRDIGNSHDMQKTNVVMNNAITAAHEDTCKALDKAMAEIKAMTARCEKGVEEYKQGVRSGGQEIAVMLESTMQTVTKAVAWVEEVIPTLRNPRLEQPIESVEPITEKPSAER
jgi:uncharacterized protein YicC (UPF0701 family)